MDVVYIEFSKKHLMNLSQKSSEQIFKMDIRVRLYQWIKFFWKNKKHTVCIEGRQSLFFDVKSGVPQGSVSGPQLFIIFISDIVPHLIFRIASSFAVETRVVKDVENQNECKNLPDVLDKNFSQAEDVTMDFTSNKFELMRCTTCNTKIHFEYKRKKA